jgi:hypothetical protein
MSSEDFMKSFIRITLLCICGAVIVFFALKMRQDGRPTPAPQEIQNSGKAILKEQLETIRGSEFGKSARGKLLCERVTNFLEQDRIIFTADIMGGEKALCDRDVFGNEIWYIEVSKNQGQYTQQFSHQIAEVTFHEALHSIKGGFYTASIEEECDAFVAGQQAEAASQGIESQDIVTLEDVPVAQFVERSYTGLSHKTDYEPVAESMDWLKKHSGL